MKVTNKPDFEVSDSAVKTATAKTFQEWFTELDGINGLKLGRRESVQHIYAQTKDIWWSTTIYVEYEKHHGILKKDGLSEGYSICVTKSISAPVEKTYSIWVDGSTFSQMFGDDGKQEVTEGGKIACNGGCTGTFLRVRPNKDLRFTWEHPGCTAAMTVDVMFQDNKGKTLMNVMTSRIQTRGESDGLRDAWSEALVRLKAMAEK